VKPRSLTAILALAAALAATAAGCGGNDSGGRGAMPSAQPAPTASPASFPAAAGHTLGELQQSLPEGPILAPSVSLLDKGTNRVGFGLFDRARKQVSGAQVAVYTSDPDGSRLRGPYVGRAESLAVKPQFESRQTATDPDAARGVYVADVPFRSRGKKVISAVVKLDGRLVSTTAAEVQVGSKGATPPAPGDKAPVIHTDTVADAGGDMAKIDTRIPPAGSLNRVDFADVLGRKPVVLVFATPQLCQSRVCGPVEDVVLQVQSQVGDGVAFVHQEIYRDNDLGKGFRPQLATYKLASEPWIFVIDRSGVVRGRFEGAVSVGELQRAVAQVRQ
jgi:hypothetical protein